MLNFTLDSFKNLYVGQLNNHIVFKKFFAIINLFKRIIRSFNRFLDIRKIYCWKMCILLKLLTPRREAMDASIICSQC